MYPVTLTETIPTPNHVETTAGFRDISAPHVQYSRVILREFVVSAARGGLNTRRSA